MGGGYDIGASGPSTSTSATSSTGPVNLNIGGGTDWTLVIIAGVVAILGLLFVLKGRKRK